MRNTETLEALKGITDLRGGGCTTPMACVENQQIVIFSQRVVIFQNCYLHLEVHVKTVIINVKLNCI